MPLQPYTGSWGQPQLLHLLRRTLFGVKKTDLTHFSGKTMQEVVTEILAIPTTPPSPPVNYYQPYFPTSPDPDVALGETWVHRPNDGGLYQFQRLESLRGWWVGLMIEQTPSILEKMTLFWHSHIPVEMGAVVSSPFYCYRYLALLRSYALGNFKNLVRDMTTDLAMMRYLNNEDNIKNAPNENYARELQELFTIGKDLPNAFTEDDVKAAARVLTGWRIAWPNTLDIYFLPSVHDSANKIFSSFYNNTVITGRSGDNAGRDELNDLINMIFAQNEVAKYIVRKLYRFFVYYKIDAVVETDVIMPLANTFRANNYEILPVLQELFTSQHFYVAGRVGCNIKNPLELTVGLARTFNLPPLTTGITALYQKNLIIAKAARQMGMEVGTPPNVAGWDAYRLAPAYHENWITSDILRTRENFVESMVNGGFEYYTFDVLVFTATLDNPANPNLLISEVLTLVHPLPSQATVITALKNILLSGQATDYYWTSAWNTYLVDTSNAVNRNIVKTRLQIFYTAVLKMVEYQLC
jgi:Protein of unknown function (DUF1800)